MNGISDGAGSCANALEYVVLVLSQGSLAGCVEGGAVRRRGRVVGGCFAWGRDDKWWMLRCRPRVVPWWLEVRVGGEGVYGDGGTLMLRVEVVVVAARVVGDDDVWCWYVVVERGAGELFGDACCRIFCFGRGDVAHGDVDGPRNVGREVEVR